MATPAWSDEGASPRLDGWFTASVRDAPGAAPAGPSAPFSAREFCALFEQALGFLFV
jgi:hypothetical protein